MNGIHNSCNNRKGRTSVIVVGDKITGTANFSSLKEMLHCS